MERSKRAALLALGRVLRDTEIPYAIIGGLALQVHQREPRTTLDIDVALLDRKAIPARALETAGFQREEAFEHSENWRAADGTPVQFTDDPLLAAAVRGADEVMLEDVALRVIRIADLLHEKLRAGSDPARRRSKRLQDLVDAERLLEENPDLQGALTPEERRILERMPE